MTKLFIFLLTLTLVSIAAMWFVENDGSLTIEWLGYRMQTSIAFAILALTVVLIICTTVMQSVLWINNAPKKYRKAAKEKKRDHGLTALTEGFAAIAAGDIKQAKRLNKQAAHCLGNIPLTKLLAAQTAQLDGNRELAKIHYTAMLESKETEVIAIKGLLLQAKQDGNLTKAIFLAEKAISLQPNAEWAISILVDLYKITKKWPEAENIIQKAVKLKIIESGESRRSLALISLGICNDAIEAGRKEDALKAIQKAYKLLPDFPNITIAYAKMLIETSNKRKAAKIIENCWKNSPHPELAEVYMSIYNEESSEKRLKRTERLLSLKPNNIYGHIAIAKAAMFAETFSKARNHLKIALSIRETRSICILMADMEKQEGSSQEVVQQWLQRAETSNPDPVWSCEKCGSSTKKWSISCNNCNSFDGLKWNSDGNIKMNIIPPQKELLAAGR